MEQFQNRAWRQSFRLHVLVLERFLAERSRERLTGEQIVYLAGVIARRLDAAYQEQIRELLLESPQQLDDLIRGHAPYIGQNAPIVTISRINAEFLTVELAFLGPSSATAFLMHVPVRYFDVAAFYSREAGNRSLADLFSFMRRRHDEVVELISGYRIYLEEGLAHDPGRGLPETLWERFGTERNERNNRKERWERMGVDPKRKQHIHREEFHKMLDFTSPN